MVKQRNAGASAMTTRQALLVGLFYFLTVTSAVLLLAAVQLRSSAGATFDTWRLNYAASQALLNTHKDQLEALQAQRSSNADDVNWTSQCHVFFEADGRVKESIDPLTAQEVKAARDQQTDYRKMPASDAKCILRGAAMLAYDQARFGKLENDLKAQIDSLTPLLASDGDRISNLVKDHQEYLAFIEMQKDWSTKPFVVTPYDLLVMFLIMCMGALGGLVRILRSYLDPAAPDPSPRDYILIPIIGMVIAIGGYVLAKTGLLLLASTKEETSLSPYMIGLVGIVSGLLAKEVIDRLTVIGGNMLQGQQQSSSGAGAGTPAGIAGGQSGLPPAPSALPSGG
jgi:hypothetical protein